MKKTKEELEKLWQEASKLHENHPFYLDETDKIVCDNLEDFFELFTIDKCSEDVNAMMEMMKPIHALDACTGASWMEAPWHIPGRTYYMQYIVERMSPRELYERIDDIAKFYLDLRTLSEDIVNSWPDEKIVAKLPELLRANVYKYTLGAHFFNHDAGKILWNKARSNKISRSIAELMQYGDGLGEEAIQSLINAKGIKKAIPIMAKLVQNGFDKDFLNEIIAKYEDCALLQYRLEMAKHGIALSLCRTLEITTALFGHNRKSKHFIETYLVDLLNKSEKPDELLDVILPGTFAFYAFEFCVDDIAKVLEGLNNKEIYVKILKNHMLQTYYSREEFALAVQTICLLDKETIDMGLTYSQFKEIATKMLSQPNVTEDEINLIKKYL